MTAAISRIAVVGAGMIGRRHAQALTQAPGVSLAALVDPSPAAGDFAAGLDVPCHADFDALLAAGGVDGVILATPNQLHAEGALAAIAAGLPVLVEKPLASDLDDARAIVDAGERAGIPVATGHHRRHNPLIAKARELIDQGQLGQIVSVHCNTWFMKPDAYFDLDWRRQKGAGPVYLNLIHDIDLMLHLVGPIARLQAMESNAIRGNEVEETATITLQFASGALGTVNVSDSAVAPWSWELTARENADYPVSGQDCYLIGGTHGSLALPSLTLWSHGKARSWWEPISATRFPVDFSDPLLRQAAQFGRVVRGEEPPVVTGRDGLAALAVIEGVKRAAATGQTVTLTG